MLKNLTLAAAIAVAACTPASAASLFAQRYDDVYALFLNAGEFNGQINAIDFLAKPVAPATFTHIQAANVARPPQPPGERSTSHNRALGADPEEYPGVSLGWTILGITNAFDRVSFGGGPLGKKIDVSGQPGGNLFLANLMISPGGNFVARVQLISVGDIVAELTATPEPPASALSSASLLGLAALRRRSFPQSEGQPQC